jgi:hypothetical protein
MTDDRRRRPRERADRPSDRHGPQAACRGDWVQIHQVLLQPGERAPQVPPETQSVPLELWVKGFLVSPQTAALGDEVEVETVTGRRHTGELRAVEPAYEHGFGAPVPELQRIGWELRALLDCGCGERGGRQHDPSDSRCGPPSGGAGAHP